MERTLTKSPRRGQRRTEPARRRVVLSVSGAVLVAGAGVGVAVVALSQHANAATPWNCTTAASLFTVADGATTVRSIDTTTGETVMMREIPGRAIGGVSHNPTDGFVYGWDQTARLLVRVDADLGLTPVPTPSEVASLIGQYFTIFAFDDQGQLWMTTTNPNQSVARAWYVVDLADGSPTYGEIVRSGNWAPPAGHYVTPDFSFAGSGMVGISAAVNDPETAPRLFGIDTATGSTVDHGLIAGLTSHAQFGSTWMGADGRLHAARNSGAIWAVDLTTREAELLVEDADLATNNADGTNCGAVPAAPSQPTPSTPSITVNPSDGALPSDVPVKPWPTASVLPKPTQAPTSATPTPNPTASVLPTPTQAPTSVTPTPKPTGTPAPSPGVPSDALSPTRSALTLYVSEHARGDGPADRNAWVLTVMNAGNTEVRNPVVSLAAGQARRDLQCELPSILVPGASATCVVSDAMPQSGATLRVRAVSGASTLVTSESVQLSAAASARPALDAEVSSQRTSGVVEVVVSVGNSGNVGLRDVALLPVRVADEEFVATCDTNAGLLLPGETTRCHIAIPAALLLAAADAGGEAVAGQFRARALPVGWATPIQSELVNHTVKLGAK